MKLKRAKSMGREKKARERRKGWEDINEVKKRKKGANASNAFEALGEEGLEKRREREWVSDENMDDEVDGEQVLEGVGREVKQLEVALPESVPLPDATGEEDELL